MADERRGLAGPVRAESVMALQALLLDSVDLFTQIKQAGWNVKGPSFIVLHGLFGALAERVEAHSDTLAERIAALGVEVHGTARAVARRSRLTDYPAWAAGGRSHVAALVEQMERFTNALRIAIDIAAGRGDVVTADLFTTIARDLDRQLWLLEAQLIPEQ